MLRLSLYMIDRWQGVVHWEESLMNMCDVQVDSQPSIFGEFTHSAQVPIC